MARRRGSHNGINGTWHLVGGRYSPIEFEVDGRTFGFYQLHTDDYGYMGMAEYPSDKAENKIELAEVRDGYWQTASGHFDKDMANKIYYNAKHKDFTFEAFVAALAQEGIEYRAE